VFVYGTRRVAVKLPMPFGAYALMKALGQGAMGDVHLARPYNARRGIPTPVVIKRLHGELASNPDFVRRFKHEAEIAVSVDSPHVAKVYDVGAVGETLYITMEHVHGWPLSKFIEAVIASGRHASIGAIVDMVAGGLEGLYALHTAKDIRTGKPLGVVHRDISPKNLMVGEDGKMRLIDLGLGKSNVQDWKTRTGVVMGSVGYMPPEQVTADKVDQRADIYAMAAVLFELLALRHYIPRGPIPVMLRNSVAPTFEPPSRFRPDVPHGLDEVIRKSLSHNAEDRHQTAADFLADMRAVVPDKRSAGNMASLIAELFAAQLPERKAEFSRLLSMPLPDVDEDGPEPEPTVTYVMAEGVAPIGKSDLPRIRKIDHAQIVPMGSNGGNSWPDGRPGTLMQGQVPSPDMMSQPMPMAEAVFNGGYPGYPNSQLQAPTQTSVPLWVLGLAVVAALAVGGLAVALFSIEAPDYEPTAKPSEAPLLVVPGPAPAPGLPPGYAALSGDAGVAPSPPSPSPSSPAPTPPKRPNPPSPSTPPSQSPTPPPSPAPRTDDATPEAIASFAQKLMQKVSTVMQSTEDPERKTQLNRLLNNITMEATSPNLEQAAKRLRQIEGQLDALSK